MVDGDERKGNGEYVIERTLNECFAGFVGQERIKNNVVSSLLGFVHGLRLPSFAITGSAGIGKSELMRRIEKATNAAISFANGQELNNSVWFDSCDAFSTLESEGFLLLQNAVATARPLVLFFDEVQSLYSGYCGPAKLALHNFIKQALDAQSAQGRELMFRGLTEPITLNHREVSISIGTNFPDSIKDKDAINRRFSVQNLELYTNEELCLITQLKLKKLGIRADERTLIRTASCGRGTCELPDKITEKLAEIARNANKNTVNSNDMTMALKMLDAYPRGLTRRECQILLLCETPGGIKTSNLSLALRAEKKGIIRDISALMSQTVDGKIAPFVREKSGAISTTIAGKMYLQSIREQGFKVSI